MIDSDFADLLERLGLGTVGTDIFIGQLPAETNGIYIVRVAGTMNNYLPTQETVIDVYVQNISSSTAATKIENVKNALHRHLETEIGTSHIFSILALGDIEDFGRDQDYGKMYKITIQVIHRSTTLIS